MWIYGQQLTYKVWRKKPQHTHTYTKTAQNNIKYETVQKSYHTAERSDQTKNTQNEL